MSCNDEISCDRQIDIRQTRKLSRINAGSSPNCTQFDDMVRDEAHQDITRSTHPEVRDTGDTSSKESSPDHQPLRLDVETDDCITSKEASVLSEGTRGPLIPPDGGYGWVVVFSGFVVALLSSGFMRSTGLIYVATLETFPDSTSRTVSWVPGVLAILTFGMSPLSSVLSQRKGCRFVTIVGALMGSVGLFLSYFAPNVTYLIFTAGVLLGIGSAFSMTASIIIVGHYFVKRRALAQSISLSGASVGVFVLPSLIKACLEEFELRGTYLILSSMVLHNCISGLLFRPVEWYARPVAGHNDDVKPLNNKPKYSATNTSNKVSGGKYQSFIRIFDLHFLKDPVFLCICLAYTFTSMALPHAFFYIPPHADEVGISKTDVNTLLLLTAFGDLIGRIFFGWVADKDLVPRRYWYTLNITIGGAAVLAITLAHDFFTHAVCGVVYGIGSGAWYCLTPVLLADYHGNEKLGPTISLARLFQGGSNLLVPLIAGNLYHYTGEYLAVFAFFGSTMLCGALVTLLLPLAVRYDERCDKGDILKRREKNSL
ncbi:monocarboxylate transporter 12-B-like [Tachypleus tridentatus]|uniref:monocarboxylate transporter 12-B-like n=1 Tax=Tachypleus tridentatus TaxID=6853 RepID=UPI003FD1C36F